MNKIASIIITLGLIITLGVLLSGDPKNETQAVQNTEIRGGVQYITVNAKGGYTPNTTTAKAGIPTKLIMKTSGVYDCSSSLAIRSIGYQAILPPEGETEIDLGIPKAGAPLEGVCSMGMYSFKVNFI